MHIFKFCILFLLIGRTLSYSQTAAADSVLFAPGQDYKAGALHRLLLGSGYRDVWTQPVKLPLLDLDNYAGGLEPVRRGGGLQTNSLRFSNPQGKIYVFRTVDKYPGRALPPDLKGTIVETLGKDQISLMLPFGSMVVSELAKRLGVMQPKPFFCVMPDDERLGEFRSDFANVLGSLEERPDENDEDVPGFGGSEKIVNSTKLSEQLDSGPDEYVDARAYLRARLLDILICDWDRHADQWRWAQYKTGSNDIWKPIARDRDFAFVIYDGFIPTVLDQRWANRDIDSFDSDDPDLVNLNHKSRFMDVRFLNRLTYVDWQEVVRQFQETMSDEHISQAVHTLPPEVYAIVGEQLIERLKFRRNNMQEYARKYYDVVFRYVDLQLSDDAEFIRLTRFENGDFNLRMARKKNPDDYFYERNFKSAETEEIRLYLLDGKDSVQVEGTPNGGVIARIIGGKGQDILADYNPVEDVYFYDSNNGLTIQRKMKTKVKLDPKEIAHDRPPVGYPESRLTRSMKGEKLRPPYDYGFTSIPLPYFGYNQDNGFYLGAGIERTYYSFRADPYASQITIFSDYSFATGAFYLEFEGRFNKMLPGLLTKVDFETAIPGDKPNFYGYGNNTSRNKDLEEEDYYRIPNKNTTLDISLHREIFEYMQFVTGFNYQFLETDTDEDTFLKNNKDFNYYEDTDHTFGLRAGLIYDSRDNEISPLKGFHLDLNALYFPQILDNDNAFLKYRLYSSAFHTLFKRVTLALKGTAEILQGTFPYYHSAFIGGEHTVRGYNKQRFAGDRSVSGSFEIRYLLGRIRIIFPSDIGVYVFTDGGRIWFQDESPGSWHGNAGAGIYFAPLMRDFTVSVSAAKSKEEYQVYWSLGFAF